MFITPLKVQDKYKTNDLKLLLLIESVGRLYVCILSDTREWTGAKEFFGAICFSRFSDWSNQIGFLS